MPWPPLPITSLTTHGRVTEALLRTASILHHSRVHPQRLHGRICRQSVRMASDEAPADASDAAQQTPEDPTWKQRQRNLIDVQACSKEAVASGKPKVIIVTGPTAVGKSHTALAIAKQLNGEIISADSVQVYKGLNIGSDKVGKDRRCFHASPPHAHVYKRSNQ